MKEIDSEVLTKIHKLLNLSDKDKNNNIEEASTALQFAHRLLKKHHLTMSQVVAAYQSDQTDDDSGLFNIEESEAVRYAANSLPKWLETIVKTTNRITDTKTLFKRIQRTDNIYGYLSIIFVGDRVDVDSSVELFNFLKSCVSKLSTQHSNDIKGSYKNWRSFAEGCSTTLLERAEELENDFDKKISGDLSEKCSIDNFEIDEEDDYEECEDENELNKQFSENFSIELYNKYQDSKAEKIKEYIDNIEAEAEKSSSKTSRVNNESFTEGQKAGETIPLNISKKLDRKRSK